MRFLNVAVMNGNPVQGRDPLDIDTMPAEEAFDVYRLMRPVFAPHSADTLSVPGAPPAGVCRPARRCRALVRLTAARPRPRGDLTDRGRRKMPALMCGADGNYLALTYRQIIIDHRASARRP